MGSNPWLVRKWCLLVELGNRHPKDVIRELLACPCSGEGLLFHLRVTFLCFGHKAGGISDRSPGVVCSLEEHCTKPKGGSIGRDLSLSLGVIESKYSGSSAFCF